MVLPRLRQRKQPRLPRSRLCLRLSSRAERSEVEGPLFPHLRVLLNRVFCHGSTPVPARLRVIRSVKLRWRSPAWGIPAVISSTLDNNYALIFPVEVDGCRHDFSEIELTYILTFYFSSIARHQPHLWLQLHAGAKDFSALLCRDILNSCENKFLRLLNAKLNYTTSWSLAPNPPGV